MTDDVARVEVVARIRKDVEADCGCRVPQPFDEVIDHAILAGIEEGRRLAGEGSDFLCQLRLINSERYEAWADGGDAGIMFDAVELAGEVGELLNVVKKLEREDRGWRGSRASSDDFEDECGDVLICLDKLAKRRGVDLGAATARKFNKTSEKVGLSQRLTAALPPSPASSAEEVR